MKRGDVIIATGPGFGKTPHPYVVIQVDDLLALPTVILLPITSELADPPSRLRIGLVANKGNGLREPSEVMADIPITTRPDKVHQTIGALSATDLARVVQALGLVLGFAG